LGLPEHDAGLLAADRPLALVAARLCDVAPDGASTLVARGVLNLTHRQGHGTVVPVTPGEEMEVTVLMQSTAYAVAAGRRLRLALSPTYWPWAWPSPEPVTLTVAGGALLLPVRVGGADKPAPPRFGDPVALKPRSEQISGGTPARAICRDVAAGLGPVQPDALLQRRGGEDPLDTLGQTPRRDGDVARDLAQPFAVRLPAPVEREQHPQDALDVCGQAFHQRQGLAAAAERPASGHPLHVVEGPTTGLDHTLLQPVRVGGKRLLPGREQPCASQRHGLLEDPGQHQAPLAAGAAVEEGAELG